MTPGTNEFVKTITILSMVDDIILVANIKITLALAIPIERDESMTVYYLYQLKVTK